MMSQQIGEFMTKCANIPYKDYSWLKDHCHRTLNRPCSPNARNEHLAVLDLIKGHEERQWIPVSERLPEKSGSYLTTILNEHDDRLRYVMTCDYFSNGRWCPDDECASSNVVAWMPSPEPYKPQEEEDERNETDN